MNKNIKICYKYTILGSFRVILNYYKVQLSGSGPKNQFMYHVTAEYAVNNFVQLLDKRGSAYHRALTEPEGIVIVKDNQSLILISQAELESWIETTELLKDPNLLSDVQASRQDYAQGEVVTMAQVFQ